MRVGDAVIHNGFGHGIVWMQPDHARFVWVKFQTLGTISVHTDTLVTAAQAQLDTEHASYYAAITET